MKKKFDPIACLIALLISLTISLVAALAYELDLHNLLKSGFFSLPLYFYIFWVSVGIPIYVWIKYFRAKRYLGKKQN